MNWRVFIGIPVIIIVACFYISQSNFEDNKIELTLKKEMQSNSKLLTKMSEGHMSERADNKIGVSELEKAELYVSDPSNKKELFEDKTKKEALEDKSTALTQKEKKKLPIESLSIHSFFKEIQESDEYDEFFLKNLYSSKILEIADKHNKSGSYFDGWATKLLLTAMEEGVRNAEGLDHLSYEYIGISGDKHVDGMLESYVKSFGETEDKIGIVNVTDSARNKTLQVVVHKELNEWKMVSFIHKYGEGGLSQPLFWADVDPKKDINE